jgi:DNA-binding Lrp family transcriptional regulator
LGRGWAVKNQPDFCGGRHFMNNQIPVTIGNISWRLQLLGRILLRKKKPQRKGETMKAYVMIKIHAGDVKGVVDQLRKIKGIVEANMTFGPYDAVAVVETGDIAELGAVTALEIQPIPGVEQTLTCLAVEV